MRKKSKIKNFIILLTGFVSLLALILIFRDRITIFAISKFSGVGIVYSDLDSDRTGWMVVEDLNLMEPRKGISLYAKKAKIRLNLLKFLERGLYVSFVLEGARFKRAELSTNPASDALTNIALLPFEGSWEYDKISGDVIFSRRRLEVVDFSALSREIRFYAEGAFYPDNTVDAKMKVSLSKDAAAKLPEELTSVAFQDERDGWKALSLRFEGNFASPSVQLSGKLFKLNIRNK